VCGAVNFNCAFSDRPDFTTAKAIMINTAFKQALYQLGKDFTRDNHGWGMADVGRLYSRRNNFPIICNECRVLSLADDTATFTVTVPSGALALRATMTYVDVPGKPTWSKSVANDLDLKVTSPSGTVHWGNCALHIADWNWSTCTDDHPDPDFPGTEILDTVEYVFLQNPQAGTWTINVIADRILHDGYKETQAMDVDFALVVSVDPDCNHNGVPDPENIRNGTSDDSCNNNGVSDECDPEC